MIEPTGHSELDALLPRIAAIAGLDADTLEAEQTALLGRKAGLFTTLLRSVADLPIERKRTFGATVNRLKTAAEAAVDARRAALDAAAAQAARRDVDLTMPGRKRAIGGIHPTNAVVDEIVGIFRGLGFSVATGPEIETVWYNFGALNFPPDHPAMDVHDTLYVDAAPAAGEQGDPTLLLRTHTSPVQIRVLQETPPPVRVVMPGMVYRKDPFDPSHAPAFLQIEGLAVDTDITFVDLKATLAHFARSFFGAQTVVRFRPSFFPFTEPSAEMDIQCRLCAGKGCPACKGTGWMEILGCGMVHPNVLASAGLDPEQVSGWAFGMGPQRIAMQRYDIRDIRTLYEGDMRVLEQFR